MIPRPYQDEAVQAVWDQLASVPSTLVVLPTGMGKTVLFGLVARRWLNDRGSRVLVLAHREELITQARDELETIIGRPAEVEMADQWAICRADSGQLWFEQSPVVVASVQTLSQTNRLQRFAFDEFGLVITDEAHHATAQTYRRIYDHFSSAKHLGVTATPRRADQTALGAIFQSVAYEMSVAQAVEQGWLVDIEQRYVTVTDLDLSRVATVAGDFAQVELGQILTGDRILDQMVAATAELCGDRPTIVFTAPRSAGDQCSQGELFADALNQIRAGSAVFLSGDSPSDVRRREVEWFRTGQRQYLVGCGLFTEGFNVPNIGAVVMARPTKSVVYYTQAIGRGTRVLPGILTPELDTPEKRRAAIQNSPKPSVLVIDFVGNSGRHKLISSVDIVAGNAPPSVVNRVKRQLKQQSARPLRPRTVRELLASAERYEAEAAARVKVRRIKMQQQLISPYAYTDGVRLRKSGRVNENGRATKLQRRWIEQHGGYLDKHATVGEAGAVIADIKRRWSQGLCSPKQERLLIRHGLASGPIPRAHAKALIDWLSSRGWRANGRPLRSELSIVRAADGSGFQLAIRDDGRSVPVGELFRTPEDVRAAYVGLVDAV